MALLARPGTRYRSVQHALGGRGLILKRVVSPGDVGERLSLSISKDALDGAVVIHVKGDLDVYTAPRLKEALDEGAAAGGSLILDLSEVDFIDSTALAVLVGTLQEAQSSDRIFRLVVDDPFLLKIFHITGFDGMFSIFPQVEDALSAN